jgi:hypothetical protein
MTKTGPKKDYIFQTTFQRIILTNVSCGSSQLQVHIHILRYSVCFVNKFFSLALQPQFGPWPTAMKLSVSLWFIRS